MKYGSFAASLLGCAAGAFALGWILRTEYGAIDATATVPVAEEPSASVPIAEEPWIPSDLRFRLVLIPFMKEEGAYHLGPSPDRKDPFSTVTVTSSIGSSGPSTVQVSRETGFGGSLVTLRFDRRTKQIEAEVETWGDTEPAPPERWENVSGIIYASSLEPGSGRATLLDYSLYGLQGGERRCIHERVSVDL